MHTIICGVVIGNMNVAPLLLVFWGLVYCWSLDAQVQNYDVTIHRGIPQAYGGAAAAASQGEGIMRMMKFQEEQRNAEQAAQSQKELAELQAAKLQLEIESKRLENEKIKREIASLSNPSREGIQPSSNVNSAPLPPVRHGGKWYRCLIDFNVDDLNFKQSQRIEILQELDGRLYMLFDLEKYRIPSQNVTLESGQ